jgi:DNA-binding CsgD family transcriptional regulator
VAWGWPLADPDSLLPTTGIADAAVWPVVGRIVDYEEREQDLNKDRDLATRGDPVAALGAATNGDLARSRRWRDILQTHGFGDELRAACVDRYGCWGHLRLYRDSNDQPFLQDDVDLVRDLTTTIAATLRRHAAKPTEPTTLAHLEPAVVVVDDQLTVRSWTAGAGPWFEAFAGDRPPTGPNARCAVLSAAARCLADDQTDPATSPPRARLRLQDGRWVIAEAARLYGHDGGAVVTVHAATTNDVLDLLARAHGLTPRERQLIALLTEGLDTRQLTDRLNISRHTVQQHLKSVFAKVGVRSRRELLTGIFATPG